MASLAGMSPNGSPGPNTPPYYWRRPLGFHAQLAGVAYRLPIMLQRLVGVPGQVLYRPTLVHSYLSLHEQCPKRLDTMGGAIPSWNLSLSV